MSAYLPIRSNFGFCGNKAIENSKTSTDSSFQEEIVSHYAQNFSKSLLKPTKTLTLYLFGSLSWGIWGYGGLFTQPYIHTLKCTQKSCLLNNSAFRAQKTHLIKCDYGCKMIGKLANATVQTRINDFSLAVRLRMMVCQFIASGGYNFLIAQCYPVLRP